MSLWAPLVAVMVSLVLVTLTAFSTHQVFCNMASSWYLSDVFLLVRLGISFGEEDRGDEVPLSCMTSHWRMPSM